MEILELMEVVKEFHKGQKYGKEDYFEAHILKVYNILLDAHPVPSEVVLKVALCHDLLEDTDMRYDDLKKLVSEEVSKKVFRLTRQKNENYFTYITNLLLCFPYDEDVLLVKLADLEANIKASLLERSECFDKGKLYSKQDRLEKYLFAKHLIKSSFIDFENYITAKKLYS